MGMFLEVCQLPLARYSCFFIVKKTEMPCGCKKGSGMYVRGGGFKRKKRRRKGRKGSGFMGPLYPIGAALRAGVGAFRGAMGPRRPLLRAAQARFVGTKRGSGRATFLSGATWHGYPKGSGMGFSGAGMSWTGSGLRGKRIAFRRGSGLRMV